MKRKSALLAGVLSLALSAPAEVAAPREIPWAAIVPVRCGLAGGTAFHIGSGRYITANHVAAMGDCSIGGNQVAKVRQVGHLDVAELSGPNIPARLNVDCSGFGRNKHYLAIGYVSAARFRIQLPLIPSAFGRDPDNGTQQFVGPDAHPGMSGGPTIGENFKVVGVTTQRWPTRARPLSDTYLCGGDIA